MPLISVVIPAYNEADWLPKSLTALRKQVAAPNFELIVVDNASTDTTSEVAKKFGARLISEPRRGVAQARETGFRAAQGEIIATTDADTLVPPNWLARISDYFETHPEVIAIGGPVKYDFSDPNLQKAVNRVIPILHELDRRFHDGQPHFVGANFAVRRDAFWRVGGFRTDLKIGEDIDLAHRLKNYGRLEFLSDLVVTTSDRRFRMQGPQAMITYFKNYLEVTRPGDVVRQKLEKFLKRFETR